MKIGDLVIFRLLRIVGMIVKENDKSFTVVWSDGVKNSYCKDDLVKIV